MESKKVLHPNEKNVKLNLIVMKKITLFLIVILLSASRFADVKEIKISGTILSSGNGSPLPGVIIGRRRC